jgi:uncharacterized protein (DUF2267 family)
MSSPTQAVADSGARGRRSPGPRAGPAKEPSTGEPVDEEEVLAAVNRWLHADEDTLWRALRATLETAAERLDKNECRHLAAELPDRIAPFLFTATPAERFDVDEFLRRVAEREGTDVATAQHHGRAVFAALREAVSDKAYSDMTAELPKDFAPLVEPIAIMAAADFFDNVARRAELDASDAQRATEAALSTLAGRIAPGEVDDLVIRLPVDHSPLKQGKASADAWSRKMSAEEFLERAAQREGVEPTSAMKHVRAVLTTLRMAVGSAEYFDVTVELPGEYATLLGLV